MVRMMCVLIVHALALAPSFAGSNTQLKQPQSTQVLGQQKGTSAQSGSTPKIRDPARVSWLNRDRFDLDSVRIESGHTTVRPQNVNGVQSPTRPTSVFGSEDSTIYGELGVPRPPRIPNTEYRPYPVRNNAAYRLYAPANSDACTKCGRAASIFGDACTKNKCGCNN